MREKCPHKRLLSKFRTTATKIDKCGPNVGQCWPTSDQHWPELANIDPIWAKLQDLAKSHRTLRPSPGNCSKNALTSIVLAFPHLFLMARPVESHLASMFRTCFSRRPPCVTIVFFKIVLWPVSTKYRRFGGDSTSLANVGQHLAKPTKCCPNVTPQCWSKVGGKIGQVCWSTFGQSWPSSVNVRPCLGELRLTLDSRSNCSTPLGKLLDKSGARQVRQEYFVGAQGEQLFGKCCSPSEKLHPVNPSSSGVAHELSTTCRAIAPEHIRQTSAEHWTKMTNTHAKV